MMNTSLEYFLPHAWYMKRYDYPEFHRQKVATSVVKYHSVLHSHFLFSYFVVVVVCSHSFILFRVPQQYYRQGVGSIKIGFSVFMFFVDKQREKKNGKRRTIIILNITCCSYTYIETKMNALPHRTNLDLTCY